jgi:MoaA/NifB/PqqE/SkfB family radical SAM enzyme
MYKLEDIKEIHLELTSKCQARCPMCPRRINGGMLNPLFDITEINLDTFKKWFSPDFIRQLDRLFMCGNLGDPIIAQDCVKVFEYLREINPTIDLSMHTNGSARTKEFWQALAHAGVRITFGIDGLEDTHALYRIGTDFDKIIDNAYDFIQAGGHAEWHMLVFKHNEHQIDVCKQLSTEMGFKEFSVKHTSRFTDDKFHVLDDAGRTTHLLEPTERSIQMIPKVKAAMADTTPKSIHCKAKQSKQLYIAADGTISPCCWLDFSWILPKQDSRIDYMDMVGLFPNLNKQSMQEIFDGGYFQQIEDTWAVKPLMECSRQCGKFDKLMEQFNG